MANTTILTVDSITSDRTSGVLLDGTTFASPVRSAVGVFVKTQKMNADATVADTLTTVGNDGDPETDTQWTFTVADNSTLPDGWYRFLYASVPDFNSASTYQIYQAVFNPTDNKVYRSKQNNNTEDVLTNTTWWEEITDPATLALNEGEANESTNIDSAIYEPGLFPNSEYGVANKIAEVSEQYLTSLTIPAETLEQYSLLALLLDGAYVKADRSEMNMAERIARRLESLLSESEE